MKTLLFLLIVLAVTVNSLSWKKFLRRGGDGDDDASNLAELERKWGVMCDLFDVDRDGSVGPEDLDTIITNFLQENNVPDSDIDALKNELRSFWNTFVIRRPNGTTVTCQEFVQIRKDLYKSNRALFFTKAENSMSAFKQFMDTDGDEFIVRREIDTFSRIFNINPLPHWDRLLKHFGASGIPIDVVSKNLILFMEKPDEDDFQKLIEGGIEDDHI